MNIAKFFFRGSVVLGFILSPLFPQAGLADGLELIDFAGLEAQWQQATQDKPLDTRGWSFLQVDSLVKASPIFTDDDGIPTIPPVNNPIRPVDSFYELATISLSNADRSQLIKRQAFLQIFLNSTSDYGINVTGQGDANAVSEHARQISQWKAQAHTELALIKLALGFDARDWSIKCRFLREVASVATIIQNPANESSLGANWKPLWFALRSFDQKFALSGEGRTGGPNSLLRACQVPPPPSKAVQEQEARQVANEFIYQTFRRVLDETLISLQGPEQAYASIEKQALASVPTDGILELRRDIENTLANLKLVKEDMMMLYQVPASQAASQEPLAVQVAKADLQKLFQQGQSDTQTLQNFQGPLASFQNYLKSILAELEKLKELPHAGAQTHCKNLQKSLEGWNLASQAVPPALDSGLNSCLNAAIEAFQAVKVKAVSPDELKKRELLGEVIAVSSFITAP